MAGKIFINYRRGDDPGHTGRLFDRLQDVFEPAQLFLDVDNIAPGLDFGRVLNERVAECDVLLAIIGKGWIDARNAAGLRRLDDPDDFVRIEIASALNLGKRVIPVLVGEAQMPRPDELPEVLRPLARRNAVRLTHERFRADTQGLVKALQLTLEEIGALQRAQTEAARIAQAEEECRRQKEETALRAEDEKRRKEAEIEAREREAEERHRQTAAAEQRAEEERAFTTAKRANSVAAIDSVLAAYPASHLADEARMLKAALVVREEAYQHALASDDPTVLGSFLATYKKGADADQVRRRLRFLEPQRRWQPLRPPIVIPAAIGVMLIAALVVWIESGPRPNTQQVSAVSIPHAPTTLAAAPIPPETKAKVADIAPPAAAPRPTLPLIVADTLSRPTSAPNVSSLPNPDEVAWSLLKDTTDDSALKRFTGQYPDSPRRKDAEARIAALTAAQAAKSLPPPEEIAWNLVKDSKDPDQLRRFVELFPNGAERPDAEQRIASLSAATLKSATAIPSDSHELARSLQFELMRVGCLNGDVNGEFDDATKAAWHRFIKLTSISMTDDVSSDAINAVRGINKRVCPLVCPHGEHAKGELCAANTPPPPKHVAARVAPPGPEPTLQARPPATALMGMPCKNIHWHRLPSGKCGY